MRALITDLDNTLYDWVTYFSNSFEAMVQALSTLIRRPRDVIIGEFKAIHQRYRNSEQPFAILELPSVRAAYPGADRRQLATHLSDALAAFDGTRDRTLALYPGVMDGLQAMHHAGVVLIGLTDAVSCNVASRVHRFGIERFFSRIYCRAGEVFPHPYREQPPRTKVPAIRELMAHEQKPDPSVLLDICRRESLAQGDTMVLGDSLARDIRMANRAGIRSIWAKYGSNYDKGLWRLLVSITHWTQEDVVREDQISREEGGAAPDYTVDDFQSATRIVLA